MLQVELISKFHVRFNGEPIYLSTRASQSLFAFLILTAGTKHRREKLAGMFWPDAPEVKARTYLRQELWRIRKSLSEKTSFEYIVADDMAISFTTIPEYQLDAEAISKLNDQSSDRELMNGLAVYQGELLPGFYEEWVHEEREHLQSLFEKRVEQLLEILRQEKRWQEILEWAEFWITHSQSSETTYQYLMLAYEALGDRVKLLSSYERCVKVLRELDLEPSEKTRSFLSKRKSSLNVPIPLTSFIGREKELKEVADLLSKSRLVTLTGSGGVGKTRLALQVVADLLEKYPDGIWFLDLAPLSDATLIPNTLANLLGLQETGQQNITITDLLVNYFRFRTSLVIFDNCEHLIESCARLVHILLTSCESLSILATSREPLRVAGEIPYRVPSMLIPEEVNMHSEPTVFLDNESVRLFADRAAADSPAFKLTPRNVVLIAQICRRLDGIPLAIELAAARTPILSVEQIFARLDDRFNLLTGGMRSALPRHQTLRATIEWSYDLLTVKERILFRRLAVFSRNWSLEAAEKVCSGDGILREEVLDLISQLVNKSLVVVDSGEEETRLSVGEAIRYRRLEIIREFAREKLILATEAGRLMDRHFEYFLKKVEDIEPQLMGFEQPNLLDILDDDVDDIRLALDWSIAKQNWEKGLRLFSALSWYWFIRCRFREEEEWFKRLQPHIAGVSKVTQAKAFSCISRFYIANDDFQTALQLYIECLNIYRELGYEREISTTLQNIGVMEYTLNNFDRAKSWFEESLDISRRINNLAAMPRALMHLGRLSAMEGDKEASDRYADESLSIARKVGDSHLLMIILGYRGDLAFEEKNYPLAREYNKEALELAIRLKNNRTIAQAFLYFAEIFNAEGRYSESARLQGFAESLFAVSETLTAYHLTMIEVRAEVSKRYLQEANYQEEFNYGRTLHMDQAVEIAYSSFPQYPGNLWGMNE